MLEAITIIGSCFALAIGIQKAFFSSDELEKLCDLIFYSKKTLPAIIIARQTGSIISRNIFERFFGVRLFSRRYLMRSLILSLAASIIVFIYLISEDPWRLFLEFLNSEAMSIFLVLLVLNYVVDTISLYQTQTFVYLLTRCKSFFQFFLILISDLILTLNIFIIVFSLSVYAFLVIVMATYVNPHLLNGIDVLTTLTKRPSSFAGTTSPRRSGWLDRR